MLNKMKSSPAGLNKMKSLSGGKKNKKVLIIIGIVIFVNLGYFVFFRSKNQTNTTTSLIPQQTEPLRQSDQSTSSDQPSVDQPITQQDVPSNDQPLVKDLPLADQSNSTTTNSDSGPSASTITISGVLIGDGNPWTLIYDDAATGSVAATLELVFTDTSLCDFGGGDTSCTPMYYEVGTGIEVTGQKDGSKLTVSRIERSVSIIRQ